mmetsp:Transcript_15519/g.10886  ORF Transcript_15519/g.10886 Transcript_15519/m.10886 type:complete len:141 (+) Transcript_15519:814-1236(+)
MGWSMSYLFLSFKNPLPWDNTDFLNSIDNNGDASAFFNADYFNNEILHASNDIDSGSGSFVPIVTFGLFMSYILVYFSVWKGVESTGKIVYVTAPLPYVFLLILLIRALTLEGASTGLKFLFLPQWDRLSDFAVWADAAN